VRGAAPDARPALAARAGRVPAARRVRFRLQRSRLGTGAERGCLPAACRPRTGARARPPTEGGEGAARVGTDGGGKVAAALNVLEGADHVARFIVGAARKGWREDFTVRFATIN